MVSKLPHKYDKQAYESFVQTFGTHYISAADYGGRVCIFVITIIIITFLI